MRYGIWLIIVLSIGLSGCQTISPAPLKSGLVGHWAFDEGEGQKAIDSSPLGNHGTNTGARYVPGTVGKALFFDDGNHSVEIDNSPSLRFDRSVSIAAWILPSEEYYTVGCIRGPDGGCIAVMKLRSMFLSPEIQQKALDSATRIPKNEWVHVAMTYDGRQLKAYINGKESSSLDLDVEFRVANAGFSIGRSTDRERSSYFRGTMDEVRLYNRALSREEIEGFFKKASANR